MTRPLQPLTERTLARLPGSRVAWIAGWALVPWLNAGANLLLEPDERSAVWDQSDTLIVLSYAAFSFAIVMAVWGADRIARGVEALREPVSSTLGIDAADRFREVNSIVGPLVAATVTAIGFGINALVYDGWLAALLRFATWFVLGVALWTFLWVYGALQLGLDRLGRERLRPEAARVDPTLGLRPLGRVAFMGLWILLASLVPLVVTNLGDVVGVVLGLVLLGCALAAFFLSLFRLHRQMVAVKATELAFARELYAEAYEPVRSARTLDALERQHGLLSAADALEKRAHAIHEWPMDEGTLARVLTVVTSVTAITAARLILDPLGL